MIITAELDLSEGGKTALPDTATTVLIFASEEHDLIAATAALNRCRLIREGHVFTSQILHSVSTTLGSHYTHALGEDGEVWTQ